MIGRRKQTEPQAASLLFLLRVWPVQGKDGPSLRAAVRSRHDEPWLTFTSLEALVATLQAALPAGPPAQPDLEDGPVTRQSTQEE